MSIDYKEKLRQFNSTEKYKSECLFMRTLTDGFVTKLDYGCGTSELTWLIDAEGFDVNDYKDSPLKSYKYHLNTLPDVEFECVYFMHSIAHIESITSVLIQLKVLYNATITVITPNASWLDPDYNNDPTVIKHYTQSELKELFVSCGYEVTLIGQFGEERNGINERIFLQAK